MSTVPIPPILSVLIGHIAAAVPRRTRITFTELLIGAAATRGGHVTDAILAAGLSRSWTTYYWLLQRGRWTWLAVWQALLRGLKMLFDPPVWHVVLDDTLVERISARAPGSLIHYNHTAKPNRPRFLRGQGWLCLAAVVEHEWKIEALPVHRTAQILYGNLEVVRYRTCRVAARFLKGRVVRAVWVQVEQPDRGDKPTEERLLICTDPDLSAITVITSYATRWSIEPLFAAIKHGWGLKDAWQQSRQVLMRWVTILAVSYALNQMLAHIDPARIPGLADPAPWRPAGARTAGLIQAGITRILRVVGLPALMALTSLKSDLQDVHAAPVLESAASKAA